MRTLHFPCSLLLLISILLPSQAQPQSPSVSWTHGLELRNVGPTVMSGRVVDLAVVPGDGSEFYVGYATGGVWHTVNHGTSFEPVSDGIGTTRPAQSAARPRRSRLAVRRPSSQSRRRFSLFSVS